MSKIRESILRSIHTGVIKPRTRGYYLLLHAVLWIACIAALVFGVLSVALLLFEINSPEYASMQWMAERDLLWLRVLPIFWAIGAVIALVLGYILFSRTDRGYRISTFVILALLCGGSLVGGAILYFSGVIHFGDQQIRKIEPRYDNFRNRFQKFLPHPEEGRLLLRVQTNTNDLWIGKSPTGEIWRVTLQCSSSECEKRISEIKFTGPPILFFGKVTDKNVFLASDIRLPPRNPAERQKFREEFGRRNISGEMFRVQKR